MGFASIYPAEYADKLLKAGTPEKLNSQPIGTGPFVLKEWQPDQKMVLTRNANWWGTIAAK